jgi:hypothetical protein
MLSYNVKLIGNFARVTLYRNNVAFFSSRLMLPSLAECLVTNPAYNHTPNDWSRVKVTF